MLKPLLKLTLTTSLAVALLAGSSVAHAAKTLPFPEAASMKNKLKEGYVLRKRTFDDKSFDFGLAVPAEWGRVTAPFDLSKLLEQQQTLALYRSDTLPTAEIELQVFPIPREVGSAEWLDPVIRSLGAKIVESRIHPGPTPVPDVLLERTLGGQRFIFRMAAFKNGDRMYVLSGRVPESGYAANADVFAAAVLSFDLINPKPIKYAEPLLEIPVVKPFAATVKVLASWHGALAHAGPDLASGKFEWKVKDQVLGAIGVKLYPPSNEKPDAFMEILEKDLKAMKVTVGSPTLDTAMAPGGPRTGGLLRVYPGKRGGIDVEVRFYVIKYATGWAVLTLVSPGDDRNAQALMINRRAVSVMALELTPK